MLTGVTSFGCALHRLTNKSFVTTPTERGNGGNFDFLVAGPWHDPVLTGSLAWAEASIQMTGGHNLFRLYALVICDHGPSPPPAKGNVEDFDFVSAVLIVTTTLWGQLDGKTMTVLPCSMVLYCTAMVSYVYQTPTFPPHYRDNAKVKSQCISQAIPALLRGFGEAVVTNDWCIIYSL